MHCGLQGLTLAYNTQPSDTTRGTPYHHDPIRVSTIASGLTPREKEIVRLISLGCTVHESAKILKLAPSTVDNHKVRAMARLGTDKAALLTRRAIKMKVSSLSDKLTAAEKRRSGRKDDGWN